MADSNYYNNTMRDMATANADQARRIAFESSERVTDLERRVERIETLLGLNT